MNLDDKFCPNAACPDRGKVSEGNIGVHSLKEKRCNCRTCGKTFSVTKGTAFYGLKQAHDLFVLVVTLLAHGCPVQAIVAALGLDARTVAAWMQRAGIHCAQVHAEVVGRAQLDLQHVQADEIKVRTQRGSFWMAMAMMVPTRLWLGGVVSRKRDKRLIKALMAQVRGCALCRPLVIAVDGLVSYVKAAQKAFRSPLREGRIGRPHLIPWANVAVVQVIKRRTHSRLAIVRRVVQGCPHMIARILGKGVINTAYIERLNATFRQRLSCLARRSRALVRKSATLTHGMYLVGCVYNFCAYHQSLRLPLYVGRRGHRRWVHRTPAMATCLTDHLWSVEELLSFKIPPPPYIPPKQRGRPPKTVILEVAA